MALKRSMAQDRSSFAFLLSSYAVWVVILSTITVVHSSGQGITQIRFNHQNGLGISTPEDLFLSADKRLWIAGDNSIVSYNGSSFSKEITLGKNQRIRKIAGHRDHWLIHANDEVLLLHQTRGKSTQEIPFTELVDSYVHEGRCYISTNSGIFHFFIQNEAAAFRFIGNPDYSVKFSEVGGRLYLIGLKAIYELKSDDISRVYGLEGALKHFSTHTEGIDLLQDEKLIRWSRDSSYTLLEQYSLNSILSWEDLVICEAITGEFQLEITGTDRKIHTYPDVMFLKDQQDQISYRSIKYVIRDKDLILLSRDATQRRMNTRPSAEVIKSRGKLFFSSINDGVVNLSDALGNILFEDRAKILDVVASPSGIYVITKANGIFKIDQNESTKIVSDSIKIYQVQKTPQDATFYFSCSEGIMKYSKGNLEQLLDRDDKIAHFDLLSSTPWLLLGTSQIEFLNEDLSLLNKVALPLNYNKLTSGPNEPYLWQGDEIFKISSDGSIKSLYQSRKIQKIESFFDRVLILEPGRLIQLMEEGPIAFKIDELESVEWESAQLLSKKWTLEILDDKAITTIDLKVLEKSESPAKSNIYIVSAKLDGGDITLDETKTIGITDESIRITLELGIASLAGSNSDQIKCRQEAVQQSQNGQFNLDIAQWEGDEIEFYIDNQEEESLKIKIYRAATVSQFPYELLAVCLFALFLIIGSISFFAQRAKTNQQREEKVKKQRKRLLELEQKALQLQMNPHFIFNSLESLRTSISEGATDDFDNNIARFSSLMRRVLNASRTEFVTLDEEVELITEYLSLEKAIRQNSFDFSIAGNILEEAELIEIPSMIIQPFIENAIIHGISPLMDRRGEISIEFSELDGKLLCILSDNGVGRKASAAMKVQSVNQHKSQGIDIIRNRLKQLDPNPRTVPIRYSDILDEKGNIKGTRVALQIPQKSS